MGNDKVVHEMGVVGMDMVGSGDMSTFKFKMWGPDGTTGTDDTKDAANGYTKMWISANSTWNRIVSGLVVI